MLTQMLAPIQFSNLIQISPALSVFVCVFYAILSWVQVLVSTVTVTILKVPTPQGSLTLLSSNHICSLLLSYHSTLFHHLKILSFQECYKNGISQMYPSFIQHNSLRIVYIVAGINGLSPLLLSCSPRSGRATVCLTMHLLRAVWTDSSSQLSRTERL